MRNRDNDELKAVAPMTAESIIALKERAHRRWRNQTTKMKLRDALNAEARELGFLDYNVFLTAMAAVDGYRSIDELSKAQKSLANLRRGED